LGGTGRYCAVLRCTGLYWAVLRCTGLYRAVVGGTGRYCAVLRCTALYRAVLGGTALYCAVLGGTALYRAVPGSASNVMRHLRFRDVAEKETEVTALDGRLHPTCRQHVSDSESRRTAPTLQSFC